MMIAAAAALGPATGNLISAATAATGMSEMVAGAAARSGSVCHFCCTVACAGVVECVLAYAMVCVLYRVTRHLVD
jgi:hypothetical protein